MKQLITKAALLMLALLLHNKTNAQLVPPSMAATSDVLWVAGGATVINTALIDVYDPDLSPNHPYKQLGACVYDGGSGGVVVRDFNSGFTVNTTFPAPTLPSTIIAAGADVILGNVIGSNTDFIMAVAFVNNINEIEVDFFDITYPTPTTLTVTYNSRVRTWSPTGLPLLGTVHIDVVAASSTPTATGLPLCDRFFVTFDVYSNYIPLPPPGLITHDVYAMYGNLNGYAITVGQKISNMCPWSPAHQVESWQPDVAGIETGPVGGPYKDVACITSVGQGRDRLLYAEWDPLLPLCTGGLFALATLDATTTHNTFSHPRIDANDDYGTNGGTCRATVVCEAFDYHSPGFSRTEVGIYNPPTMGAVSVTSSWVDVSSLPIGGPYPGVGGFNHYRPAVAYGPNGGSEYMVTECAKEFGGPDEFFMMSPVDCGAALAGTNFYEVNSVYPATSSVYANSVSTPCNNVTDSSLVAWTHGGNIYYKRTGFGYAYKPTPGQPQAEPSNSSAIAVWPNPSADMITVSNPVSSAANSYSIRNVLGQLMQKGAMAADKQEINVKALPAGNYIIHLCKDGAPAGNKMFLKK